MDDLWNGVRFGQRYDRILAAQLEVYRWNEWTEGLKRRCRDGSVMFMDPALPGLYDNLRVYIHYRHPRHYAGLLAVDTQARTVCGLIFVFEVSQLRQQIANLARRLR